jgi:hypothetical protein
MYKILSFELKKTLQQNIMSIKNNLTIVIGSEEQRGAQVVFWK